MLSTATPSTETQNGQMVSSIVYYKANMEDNTQHWALLGGRPVRLLRCVDVHACQHQTHDLKRH